MIAVFIICAILFFLIGIILHFFADGDDNKWQWWTSKLFFIMTISISLVYVFITDDKMEMPILYTLNWYGCVIGYFLLITFLLSLISIICIGMGGFTE